MAMRRTGLGTTIVVAFFMIDALVLLNGAYLWDLIVDKHDGWILLGWKAYAAIAMANAAIIGAMAWLFARASRPGRSDAGPSSTVGR